MIGVKYVACIICGALAGMGGAFLTTCYSNTYVDGNVAGRGFIALAAVIFGRWSGGGVLLACLFFGFCDALQIRLQVGSFGAVSYTHLDVYKRQLKKLAQCKLQFEQKGIKIAVMERERLDIVNDKGKLLTWMKENGLPVPDFYLVENWEQMERAAYAVGWPEKAFCAKAVQGNGSRAIRVIETAEALAKDFFERKDVYKRQVYVLKYVRQIVFEWLTMMKAFWFHLLMPLIVFTVENVNSDAP